MTASLTDALPLMDSFPQVLVKLALRTGKIRDFEGVFTQRGACPEKGDGPLHSHSKDTTQKKKRLSRSHTSPRRTRASKSAH